MGPINQIDWTELRDSANQHSQLVYGELPFINTIFSS
jgi:hypothetical protein